MVEVEASEDITTLIILGEVTVVTVTVAMIVVVVVDRNDGHGLGNKEVMF